MSYTRVLDMIEKEQDRQNNTIELIASENFVSNNILRAVGSCLTNKYSEGYPVERISGNTGRYYGGCQFIDEIEEYCCEQWRKVFNTNYHVNVQPHSGSNANMAAYMSVLKPGDTILSLELSSGGHLTHGSHVNFSGKTYNFVFYNLDEKGFIDYNDLWNKICKHHPKLVLAGASAYSRIIDFERINGLIDKYYEQMQMAVGHWASAGTKTSENTINRPYFMVDMAHIAGLVAAGEHPSPFGIADIITTTTHKTLRGPRGGLIFCRPELAKKIDSAIFPGIQGGPLQHIIAGKAIAAEEAQTTEYKEYIHQVVKNCKAMSDEFKRLGYKVITDGTDNHLLLLDLTSTGITGKELQDFLDTKGITLNKNCIPNEKRSPKETSGVRIGTAAMTTKGYNEQDFVRVAQLIDKYIAEYKGRELKCG